MVQVWVMTGRRHWLSCGGINQLASQKGEIG